MPIAIQPVGAFPLLTSLAGASKRSARHRSKAAWSDVQTACRSLPATQWQRRETLTGSVFNRDRITWQRPATELTGRDVNG
ncbi:hypothetical protein NS303_20225 [Pantoea ananatis]|nr:hypothetical protein NS303_20225 [Pantoea ananatis]KTR56441.1 hypothetical protein NS311_07215 [Pantoea ananatis]KTR66001.1 hypothetical protein RSA47_08235 [Pantoea ananatis]KTR71503.1 hypothetical protein NS296_06795 [Pantoea ananatis]